MTKQQNTIEYFVALSLYLSALESNSRNTIPFIVFPSCSGCKREILPSFTGNSVRETKKHNKKDF